MVCKGIVRGGVIEPAGSVKLQEGQEVWIETGPAGTPARVLLRRAGTWRGDDADAILDLIYKTRSKSVRGEGL